MKNSILFILILFCLSASSEAFSATKYEAESASGSGTSIASSSNASGNSYVQMQEGSLTFTVNVTTAGMYDVVFVFSQTYGDTKQQNLLVNNTQVGSVTFVSTGSTPPVFSTVSVPVSLNSGTNTIGLTKSWGWVDIDYIEISEHAPTQFSIDENLVTPNPYPGAVDVYDFLKENFGKNVISGAMTLDVLNGENALSIYNQSEFSYIYAKSGEYPVILGFDLMHATGLNTSGSWFKAYTNATISMAKELWQAGGIPTFSWHWRDPNQNSDAFYTADVSFSLANAFTSSACTAWNENSTEYKNIIKDIDVIAGYLLQLQCAGVAVLWRPIHEASGAWFWWGASGSTAYKQLYKLLFERLVTYHNLHNLIWVWNSDGTDADWYPGDEYVDVVGRDFYYSTGSTYNHSSLVGDFESVASVVDAKKIITLAECGAVPYPSNMVADGAMWSWFMPWYGDYTTSSDHNTASDWNTIMNDSHTITLSDMSEWNTSTNIYDTVELGNVYTENNFSVTPSVVGDTEYTQTKKSVQGCDSVIVLFLHTKASAVESYNVRFEDWDGTLLKNEVVEKGSSATAPDNPTREGFSFVEWNKSFDNITAEITITAVYADSQSPELSGEVEFTGITTNSVTISWTAATDNVSVANYEIYVNGSLYTTVSAISVGLSDLEANTAYTIKVRAVDDEENSSEYIQNTFTTKQQQTIDLKEGWNLISFYVLPDNATIENVFADNISKLDIIKNDNGFYKNGTASALQSLTQLKLGDAYLVKMTSDVEFSIEGTAALSVNVQLLEGWNLLGYPKATNGNVETELSDIWQNVQTIKDFDSFKDKDSGTLETLMPGKGYYIYMNSDSSIIFE